MVRLVSKNTSKALISSRPIFLCGSTMLSLRRKGRKDVIVNNRSEFIDNSFFAKGRFNALAKTQGVSNDLHTDPMAALEREITHHAAAQEYIRRCISRAAKNSAISTSTIAAGPETLLAHSNPITTHFFPRIYHSLHGDVDPLRDSSIYFCTTKSVRIPGDHCRDQAGVGEANCARFSSL